MNYIDFSSFELSRLILGFTFSMLVAGLVLWLIIEKIAWPYIKGKSNHGGKPKGVLTIPLGILESASYTVAVLIGAHIWIGVWLVFKVAAQWKRWQNEERITYNVFLIGNLLSLFFGIAGAWIACGKVITYWPA